MCSKRIYLCERLRYSWKLNRIFRIMSFFKHMGDYLTWDLYAKFQRSGLECSRVISERSLDSTGSFAGKTRTAYCENPCAVLVYNSPKSMMLRDLVLSSTVILNQEPRYIMVNLSFFGGSELVKEEVSSFFFETKKEIRSRWRWIVDWI